MRSIGTLLILTLVPPAFLAPDVRAEDANDMRRPKLTGSAESSIRGLSADELTRQLGKPDTHLDNGNRAEWRYGNSLVFLTDGHVTAWSDSGDLQNRQMMAMLRRPDQNGANRSSEPEGWINAWQREAPITSDDVVAELLRK